jgi:predicted MFS family arabinose efflux permease
VKRVLRIPAYRRLLAAYTLNELAFTMGSLALALLVYGRTGSAVGAAGFFLFSQFVPALISPLVVARLDHLSSRAVLPIIYWLEAIVFVVLAFVSSHFSVAAVLGLSLLDGIAALVARSLARTATVSVTSAPGLLREGNALANAAFSVTFMVGPALGGAIVVAGGTSTALLAVSALFAVIGVTLVTAAGLPETATARGPARGRVRAALDYACARPMIRNLLILTALGLLFFTISVPVEVVFAQHSLHAGPAGYGGLLSAWGAGAVGGSAVYARWRGLPHRDLIALGAFGLGVGFLVMAIAPTLAAAIAGAAVAGVGNGIEAVSARTALQEEVEERWMALMMSLNESMLQTVPGAGILIGGAITTLGNARAALAVAAVGSLAVTAAAWVALAPLASRRIAAADPARDADPRQPPSRSARGEDSRPEAPRTPVV